MIIDLPREHADLVEPLLVDKDIALVPLVSLTRNRRQEEGDPLMQKDLSMPLLSME